MRKRRWIQSKTTNRERKENKMKIANKKRKRRREETKSGHLRRGGTKKWREGRKYSFIKERKRSRRIRVLKTTKGRNSVTPVKLTRRRRGGRKIPK